MPRGQGAPLTTSRACACSGSVGNRCTFVNGHGSCRNGVCSLDGCNDDCSFLDGTCKKLNFNTDVDNWCTSFSRSPSRPRHADRSARPQRKQGQQVLLRTWRRYLLVRHVLAEPLRGRVRASDERLAVVDDDDVREDLVQLRLRASPLSLPRFVASGAADALSVAAVADSRPGDQVLS